MNLNLRNLIDKLNDLCKRALEAAAGMCLSRTHYNVEIEHWFCQLLNVGDSDLAYILRHHQIDRHRLSQILDRSLEELKTGNAQSPALSQRIIELIQDAWLVASLDYQGENIRSGHLLCALLRDNNLFRFAPSLAKILAGISVDSLKLELPKLICESVESETREANNSMLADAATKQTVAATTANTGTPTSTAAHANSHISKTAVLDQFTNNLNELALRGELDQVIGRDAEIRQMIDILTRRRQNNPILTGEPGVGKTAVVEGLALRVVAGDVPDTLKNVCIRTLDLGLLQAGAGVKGEFENRLKTVIKEVKQSLQPIILFIDEAHTIIGAGAQAGQGDAANLLKPALARGELRTIAATTWAEYKKYFEQDAALARRFQVVKVEEPNEQAAIAMMRGLSPALEQHHGVRIQDEAVVKSVQLTQRYLAGRQLPDKSVSVLDTACARVALSHTTTPAIIEDCKRQLEHLATEVAILQRENVLTKQHNETLRKLEQQRRVLQKQLTNFNAQWETEKTLHKQIREVRNKLENKYKAITPQHGGDLIEKTRVSCGTNSCEGAKCLTSPALARADFAHARGWVRSVEYTKALIKWRKLSQRLAKVQGEFPLLQDCVNEQVVAEVIAGWTGIPIGRMLRDEINSALVLEKNLATKIIGQQYALSRISKCIHIAKAKMSDPSKPMGVFLFVGPSGTGKTETALVLAELLYGGRQQVTTINMSEFKEEHKVSLLMGSPPGYVGYGEGGVLTEAIRRKPYSLLLLDEMEKAHVGVQDIFYQVFDKGTLKDGQGRDINFKNSIIIMTSNIGAEVIAKLCRDPATMPEQDGLVEALYPELLKTFKPAFLGRVNVVPYLMLSDEVMQEIIKLQLALIQKRVAVNYGAALQYGEELVAHIAARCKEVATGARNIEHILMRGLLPELSAEFLARLAEGKKVQSIHINVGEVGDAKSLKFEII